MNLQSFKRALPVFTLLVIAAVLVALPAIRLPSEATRLYATCSSLAISDPVKAIAFAHGWRARQPDLPAAKHCEALALFATKDYVHAATAFAALAHETGPLSPALTARLFIQAAKAYELTGQYDAAAEAATSALSLEGSNKEAKDLLAVITKEKATNTPPTQPQGTK